MRTPPLNYRHAGFCDLHSGIIEAVAKDFFDSEVTMTILNQSEEDERTGKKEHVVFHMLQKVKLSRRKAQTKQKDEETVVERKACTI